MRNELKKTVSGIIGQGTLVANALAKHSQEHGLTFVDPAAMTQRIEILSEAAYVHRKSNDLFQRKKTALYDVTARARKLLRLSRNVIMSYMDEASPTLLATAGFVGSLAIPRNYDALDAVMEGMKNYLTKHPEQENAKLQVTAADIIALKDELLAARVAVNEQKGEVQRLMKDRDNKAKLVRKDMQTVLAELRLKKDPLSEVYLKFGFRPPGLQAIPEAPQNLTVSNAPGVPEAKWERPPRARYYHVWIKVVGTDEDFRLIGTRRNCDILFKDLPPNAEVEVALSALNSGGESVRSTVVTFRT